MNEGREGFEEFPAWTVQGARIAPDAVREIDGVCPRGHLVAVVWQIAGQRQIEMAIPVTFSETDEGRYLRATDRTRRVLWELRPFASTRLHSKVTGAPILHCSECRQDLVLDRRRILDAIYNNQSRVHLRPSPTELA